MSEKSPYALRLARSEADIRACQALRYRVFYEELAARPEGEAAASRLDADRFDPICDHLLVIATSEAPGAEDTPIDGGVLVGTYRMLRQEIAEAHFGFYTESEFDVRPMIAAHPHLRFLELGRSCVLRSHRTKPVLELLWQGIWDFVRAHRMDVMFGCASLEGADPQRHRQALGLLASLRETPTEWRAAALPTRRVDMPAGKGAFDRRALHALPPLIKGYLRLGCYIGEGAVIDTQFDTVDILIVLPVSAIDKRYFGRFGGPND
ncbi:MAG: GNAT family N-acetyltransferase [Alphaproteobacteria bacterium]|nr:GNAT family N-acetyltransferase [Alphaproteobacteria bacterium]